MPNIESTGGVAGGVPIKVGCETFGAIGLSGAVGGDKDEACEWPESPKLLIN